ncbi:MAG: thermonuclease family protein [Xanthobacteraceae bacterium]
MRLSNIPMPSCTMLVALIALNLGDVAVATAASCGSEMLGQGRVTHVVDARTLQLSDGRQIRLAGIEPPSNSPTAKAALAALVDNRDVSLWGDDDAPDRYGRQHLFVAPTGADTTVQDMLLRAGAAMVTGTTAAGGCRTELVAAETAARQAGQGIWAAPDVIKNARSPSEILAKLGQFTLAEGKVVSARQSGATFYLNFGRRWRRDFAVIIPKQMIGLLARDGIDVRTLAGHRIRVRGWIEQRGGPRIEVRGTGQVEVLDRS